MALFQLLRKILPNNTGVGLPFYAQLSQWNSDTRTVERTQEESATANPAELAKDALVTYYEYAPGKAMGVYAVGGGTGGVYTKKFPAGSAGVLNNVEVKLGPGTGPVFVSSPGTTDACLDLTGRYGLPPYQTTLVGLSGPAAGYLHTDASPHELFPVRVYNLAAGKYRATVADALGHSATKLVTITEGTGEAMGVDLIANHTAAGSLGIVWSYDGHNIQQYLRPAAPPSTYQLPYGSLVDGYFQTGLTQWRRVYSDGSGDVYYTDQVLTELSTLALENLIVFHPDTPAEANGGFIVEARADHLPLTYALSTPAGPVATNQVGTFEGLSAAVYTLRVTDTLGAEFTITYELKDRYGLRWQHAYSDVARVPCRLELWTASYAGAVEPIIGQAEPVLLQSDGLSSSIGGQGDMGAVVATTAQLNLEVTTETFAEIISGDRYCRCDFYYNHQLYFRGFVEASTYKAPLLPGLQPVSLTATDGLAALKGTAMTGHEGQRLNGHRPWLNTLLHCLSRCDVALPVRIYTNVRDANMATTEAPELAATSNRTGYYELDKDTPLTQRQTIEAVAQALRGTLVQRAGAWEIRGILEAAHEAPGRAYRPAGTPLPPVLATAPTAVVLPPTQGLLHWRERSQQIEYRAGWKSLVGQTDVGYLKNAYVAGRVFSDKNAWLEDLSRLSPLGGWRPAVGTTFPLLFGQLGANATDYTTRWLRSSSYSTWHANEFLQGPALPLAGGLEAVPATLNITGRLVPAEYYLDGNGNQVVAPTNASKAVLSYELVIDGQPAGVQFVEFALADTATASDTTVSAPLPALPSGTLTAELRLYSWYAADTLLLNKAVTLHSSGTQVFAAGDTVRYDFGLDIYRLFVARRAAIGLVFLTGAWPDYFAELTATNGGLGSFYLSEVGVQLTPQDATWAGADNFRADGAAGSIRPTEALAVFHADVPVRAGLYGGNLSTFVRAVALADGTPSTSWRRALDLAPSPLFEGAVFDGLALRDGISRLLTGELSHQGAPPVLLLDTLDLPLETAHVAAHRYCVCAATWHTKRAFTDVSLVQNGPSDTAPNPYADAGQVLVTDLLYQYRPGQYVPYALGCEDGALLSWD